MEEIIFELNSVSFKHAQKFPALNNIDLAIKKGEKVALMGANGTGKSTLLGLLDGLIFAQSGSFRAFGRPVNERDFNDEQFTGDYRKKVGFVFQNPDVQLFCPTVEEDILFGPLQLGLDLVPSVAGDGGDLLPVLGRVDAPKLPRPLPARADDGEDRSGERRPQGRLPRVMYRNSRRHEVPKRIGHSDVVDSLRPQLGDRHNLIWNYVDTHPLPGHSAGVVKLLLKVG